MRNHLAVSAAFVLCVGSTSAAQQEQEPPRRPIAESAERIGREMWPLGAPSDVDAQGRPRFRSEVEVELEQFELPPPWIDEEGTSRVRPRGTAYHRQFLESTTPQAFRASTLYPAGVGVDPGAMIHGIKSAWREWQERRVRARIAREVAALERSSSADR